MTDREGMSKGRDGMGGREEEGGMKWEGGRNEREGEEVGGRLGVKVDYFFDSSKSEFSFF